MHELPRTAAVTALTLGAIVLLAASVATPHHGDVPLASLDLAKMRVQPAGGRAAQAQTVAQANKSIDGNPLHIGGREFAEGVGTRATSVLFVNLAGGADRFSAMVGADDNPTPAPPAGAPTPALATSADADRVPRRRRRTRAAREQARRPRRCTRTGRRRRARHQDAGAASQTGRRHACRRRELGRREILGERRFSNRHRHSGRATRSPHAEARARAAHQRSVTDGRHAGARRAVQDSGDRHPSDQLRREESAEGPNARRRDRYHPRNDRHARALSGHVHGEERRWARHRRHSHSSPRASWRSRRRWGGTAGTRSAAR